MTFLPSVIRGEYRGGFRIHLTFNDLSKRTVDFRPWLEGPVFEALKDPAYSREFFVDEGTVVWRKGADIAPETLYSAPIHQGEAAASERTRGKRHERALRRQGSGGRATANDGTRARVPQAPQRQNGADPAAKAETFWEIVQPGAAMSEAKKTQTRRVGGSSVFGQEKAPTFTIGPRPS